MSGCLFGLLIIGIGMGIGFGIAYFFGAVTFNIEASLLLAPIVLCPYIIFMWIKPCNCLLRGVQQVCKKNNFILFLL